MSRRRKLRYHWGRIVGLLAALVSGAVLAGPLQAGHAPDEGSLGEVDLVDWQAVAQQQEAELKRLRRRERRARRLAHRRSRIIRRLTIAMRSSVEGPARVGLRCIHPHEASWTDDRAPYWGGLQMDLDFQRTYGGPLLRALGTANHWPPAAQLAVGEIAYYAGRGYGPWPNTRKACGL